MQEKPSEKSKATHKSSLTSHSKDNIKVTGRDDSLIISADSSVVGKLDNHGLNNAPISENQNEDRKNIFRQHNQFLDIEKAMPFIFSYGEYSFLRPQMNEHFVGGGRTGKNLETAKITVTSHFLEHPKEFRVLFDHLVSEGQISSKQYDVFLNGTLDILLTHGYPSELISAVFDQFSDKVSGFIYSKVKDLLGDDRDITSEMHKKHHPAREKHYYLEKSVHLSPEMEKISGKMLDDRRKFEELMDSKLQSISRLNQKGAFPSCYKKLEVTQESIIEEIDQPSTEKDSMGEGTPNLDIDFADASDPVLLGCAIRSARLKAGLSQEQLSKITKLSIRTISRLETGKGSAPLKTLQGIASATNTELQIAFKPKL